MYAWLLVGMLMLGMVDLGWEGGSGWLGGKEDGALTAQDGPDGPPPPGP